MNILITLKMELDDRSLYSCLDILHSYLGLATLATMREPELRSIDPTLCISVAAREMFEEQLASNLYDRATIHGNPV